jgi:hypothetical protein
MASIPISQIPNAPQGAGPVLQDHLPGISPLQPLNLGGGLDASGLGRTQALMARGSDSISQSNEAVARATAANKRDLIDPSPFVNAAGAGEFVGKALEHAGAVASDFAAQMQQAKDTRDLMQVDDILNDAADEQRLKMAGNQVSPDQWVPTWNASQPDVLKRIEALGISPRIRQKVADGISSFWGRQTMSFAIDATKQSLSDAGESLRASVQKAVARQDFEGAFKRIQDGVSSRILSASQGESLRQGVESTYRDNLVNTAINADPKSFAEASGTAMRTGKRMEGFEWLNPAQIARANGFARTRLRQQREDSYDNADASIQSGEFTTPEQIESYGQENDWSSADLRSFKNSLKITVAGTVDGQAKYQASLDALQTKVSQYDPKTDPDGGRRRRLRAEIRETAIEGDRQDFIDEISQKVKGGMTPADRLKAKYFDEIDTLREHRLLRPAGAPLGDSAGTAEKDLALSVAARQAKAEFAQYLAENPNATASEARERFQQIISPDDAAAAAARAFQAAPGRGLFRTLPDRLHEVPDFMKGKPTSGRGTPFRSAVATTFGYRDDGQDNGVGAWGDITNDPHLKGIALPIELLRERFGDEDKARGHLVEVHNPATGVTIRVPIVDKGPADSTRIDLTHAANEELGGTGKTQMQWRFL